MDYGWSDMCGHLFKLKTAMSLQFFIPVPESDFFNAVRQICLDAARIAIAEYVAEEEQTKLLTTQEAAAYLKVSRQTIEKWSKCGLIIKYKMAGANKNYFKAAELKKVLINSKK